MKHCVVIKAGNKRKKIEIIKGIKVKYECEVHGQ